MSLAWGLWEQTSAISGKLSDTDRARLGNSLSTQDGLALFDAAHRSGVANLVPLIASGAVDPYITGVYTREQAPEAHRLLEGRASQGKLALVHPN